MQDFGHQQYDKPGPCEVLVTSAMSPPKALTRMGLGFRVEGIGWAGREDCSRASGLAHPKTLNSKP